jgi:hypothetical protein
VDTLRTTSLRTQSGMLNTWGSCHSAPEGNGLLPMELYHRSGQKPSPFAASGETIAPGTYGCSRISPMYCCACVPQASSSRQGSSKYGKRERAALQQQPL